MNIEDLTIQFGSTKSRLGDLLKPEATPLPPFDRSVVDLCRRWVSTETQFEVSTSGSTGTPKKIVLQRDQLQASALTTGQALALTEGMSALLCLDPQFIAGKMMVIRCLVIGIDLIAMSPVANPLDHLPPDVLSIDLAAMVPLQVITALDSPRAGDFDKFRTVIIGGGPVDRSLRERLQTLRTACYATFGMTETISHVALQKLNGEDQSDYLHAVPGVSFSTDERGCLVIDAPFAQSNRIVTNDIVELIDPQKFQWLGRWDHVINTGGIKVMPEVVEPQIAGILVTQGVENNFFIHGMDHPGLGQEVVLVLEGKISTHVELTILESLRSHLPKYAAPRRVIYADKFSFTATGKVKRKETVANASPRPGI